MSSLRLSSRSNGGTRSASWSRSGLCLRSSTGGAYYNRQETPVERATVQRDDLRPTGVEHLLLERQVQGLLPASHSSESNWRLRCGPLHETVAAAQQFPGSFRVSSGYRRSSVAGSDPAMRHQTCLHGPVGDVCAADSTVSGTQTGTGRNSRRKRGT